jgi:hypothetical protein
VLWKAIKASENRDLIRLNTTDDYKIPVYTPYSIPRTPFHFFTHVKPSVAALFFLSFLSFLENASTNSRYNFFF